MKKTFLTVYIIIPKELFHIRLINKANNKINKIYKRFKQYMNNLKPIKITFKNKVQIINNIHNKYNNKFNHNRKLQ